MSATPHSMGGDIVASVGVLTIAGLVYRFMAKPPTRPSPHTSRTSTLPILPASIVPTPSTLPPPSTSTSHPALPSAFHSSSASPTPLVSQEGEIDSALPSPNGHVPSKAVNGPSQLTPSPSSSLPLPTLNPPPTSASGRYAFIPSSPIQGGLGKVALYLAAARALESSLPSSTPPLFSDVFAAPLAGDFGASFLRAIASASSLTPSTLSTRLAVRAKYFDDELVRAVTVPLSRITRYVSPTKIRQGTETSLDPSHPSPDASDVLQQVVVLPVGSDTRSLRLSLPDYVTVWEVDTEETLAHREEVISAAIEKLGGEAGLPSKARVVPVAWDVMGGVKGLGEALQGAGFNPLKPTVWLCEGTLWVMRDSACKALLTMMAQLSASHSVLLCDAVNACTVKADGQKAVMEAWRAWGVKPMTGFDLPEAVFAQCGWSAKVMQRGQEWEVDWGRVDEEEKRFYLKDNVRGGSEDWPREWIINAKRT